MNRHARQLFYFGWGNLAPVFNPLAQAVAILAKYGGSLWVADSAYTFTGSDGTGAAGDGSDAGYVRDLCGNARPLTQPTTSFKPKLRRVPKRLGAELVTNGDFAAGNSGWTGSTPGTSFTGGALNITSASGEYQGTTQLNVVQVGRTYVVQADVVINSGTGGVAIATAGVSVAQFTTGKLYGTLVATGTNNVDVKRSAASAVSATVDNVSVREVLEWGWAWVFDGVDDILATVSQAAVTGETFGIACQHIDVNPFENLFAKRVASPAAGWLLFADKAQSRETLSIQGFTGATVASTTSATVISARAAPTALAFRKNGSQVVAPIGTYTPAVAPVQIGGFAGNFSRPSVQAAFYAPAAIPDAELLIVEKAMAQLGGITI